MGFFKHTKDGYILAVGKSTIKSNITEEEYNSIVDVIRNAPPAQYGKRMRLREDLTWDVFEIPEPTPEEEDTYAPTAEDYETALSELGVK